MNTHTIASFDLEARTVTIRFDTEAEVRDFIQLVVHETCSGKRGPCAFVSEGCTTIVRFETEAEVRKFIVWCAEKAMKRVEVTPSVSETNTLEASPSTRESVSVSRASGVEAPDDKPVKRTDECENCASLQRRVIALEAAARAVLEDARDQGGDDCMDDLVDEQYIERLRMAVEGKLNDPS